MCYDKEKAISHLSYLLTKKAENITSPFKEEYEKEINAISEKMLIIKDEIALLKEGVSHSDTSSEEIKKQLEYYKAERLDILKKISAIDMAISAIEHAKSNIATDFTPIVTQKAMEYISRIAPKEGRKISLSENLSLEVSDPVPRDFSSYSKGFLDVAYLCYRLALSEFLFSESLPIILDNPFSSSDDYRQESLLKLLVSLSEKHQIIVFTNRKSTTFDQLNCNYIDISYKNGV